MEPRARPFFLPRARPFFPPRARPFLCVWLVSCAWPAIILLRCACPNPVYSCPVVRHEVLGSSPRRSTSSFFGSFMEPRARPFFFFGRALFFPSGAALFVCVACVLCMACYNIVALRLPQPCPFLPRGTPRGPGFELPQEHVIIFLIP